LRNLDDMPKAAELRQQAATLKTAEQKAEGQTEQNEGTAPSDGQPQATGEEVKNSDNQAAAATADTGSTDEDQGQTRQSPQQD
jgi:hypothetical protein